MYDGLWFTPMREALDAFFATVQERVTGTVRVKLFKGHCTVVGRSSPHSLYDSSAGDRTTPAMPSITPRRPGSSGSYGLPAEAAARRAPRRGPPQAKR